MCFFAHALEELREPSNPLDTLPEGGIGSGTAPRMSMDGLANANAINGLLAATAAMNQPQRQSIDVASLAQMQPNVGPAAAAQINVNNLISELHALNVQDQVRQNQQLANQLIVGLLGELAANQKGQPQHQQQNYPLAPATNFQQDLMQQTTLGFGNGVSAASMAPSPLNGGQTLPRWSVDGHLIATPARMPANQLPIQTTLQFPHPSFAGNTMMPMYPNQEAAAMRTPSFESSIRDTVTQGMTSMGRVSIDNSYLGTTPVSPQNHGHFNGVPMTKQLPKQSFQSIVEDPGRSSDDGSSSGPSSGDYSTDCRKSESFPVSYPLETEIICPDPTTVVDSTLPEPFILF